MLPPLPPPASPAPDSPVPSEPATTIPVPRKVLERMVQSNNRQLTLINSLLEAHASDVQGITLHQEAIALLALVESILEDLDPLLVKNQASLENLIPQDLPTVNVDANQLRRVYENLIANALKHNPPGLNLTLSAEVEALMLHCTVADNGVGIHPDQAERLFDSTSGARMLAISPGLVWVCISAARLSMPTGAKLASSVPLGRGQPSGLPYPWRRPEVPCRNCRIDRWRLDPKSILPLSHQFAPRLI